MHRTWLQPVGAGWHTLHICMHYTHVTAQVAPSFVVTVNLGRRKIRRASLCDQNYKTAIDVSSFQQFFGATVMFSPTARTSQVYWVCFCHRHDRSDVKMLNSKHMLI